MPRQHKTLSSSGKPIKKIVSFNLDVNCARDLKIASATLSARHGKHVPASKIVERALETFFKLNPDIKNA